MGERYVFWMRLREEGIPDAARGGVRILWVSCLEIAHRTPLAGECPLFSAWGRFEDGAPRFACPVRPLGRLSLGLIDIGVGLGFPSLVSSPQAGVCEVGLGLSFVCSSPEFGVDRVLQVKNGWRIRSGTANTPPKHTTLHKTMQSARDQPSRKVPVTPHRAPR